ncbi:hypothetical protein AALM99_02120, partial [Lactococcus muris]
VSSLSVLPLALGVLTILENGFYFNKVSQKQTKKLPEDSFSIDLSVTHFTFTTAELTEPFLLYLNF